MWVVLPRMGDRSLFCNSVGSLRNPCHVVAAATLRVTFPRSRGKHGPISTPITLTLTLSRQGRGDIYPLRLGFRLSPE